jgi:acetyl esterase/lipase
VTIETYINAALPFLFHSPTLPSFHSILYPNMVSTTPIKVAESSAPTVPLTSAGKKATMSRMIQAAVAMLPPLPDTLEEFDIYIPVQDGWKSRTKIVRPKSDVSAKAPLIVHFFGGAMIVGEPEQLLNVAREFAETYGAVVALPSYRLTPEVRWPVPYKDGWDVLVWLSKHAEAEIGANLDTGFIVGGASAGGAVAAVCGGLAMFPNSKEAQEVPKLAKPLTGQLLCVPGLLVEDTVPAEYKAIFTSREDNKNALGLDAAGVERVWDELQCTDYTSLWFSPVPTISSQEPVHKIPAYLEHCGLDPLRDDITVYGKLLESRGVPTKMQLFPEDGHQGWTIMDRPPKAKNPTIREAQLAGMKWLLSLS